MAAVDVIRIRQGVQYTGSNSAEILALSGGNVVSEGGGVLQIGDHASGYVAYTMNTGDWWETTENVPWPGAMFADRHVTKAAALADTNTVYDPTALTARVTAAEAAIAAKVTGTSDIASISVPILLLGATADRPIVWNRPFATANYNLSFAPDASTLGRVTPSVVAGTKTATGVTIRLTAGLAVSVLGVVHVLATT